MYKITIKRLAKNGTLTFTSQERSLQLNVIGMQLKKFQPVRT